MVSGKKLHRKCNHPNFFFKEFKFYCRVCGEKIEEKEDDL